MRIPATEVKVPNATLFVVCGCEEAFAIRRSFMEAYKHPYCVYVACFDDAGNKVNEFKSVGDGFVSDEW